MAIGGYFELELHRNTHFHDALKLNTARNCLEYILRVRRYSKIFIPYYTCDALLEPIHKLNLEYEFYHIDENFQPVFTKELRPGEAFLYTNYFGFTQKIARSLRKKIPNLIIDNCQAFYTEALEYTDTFYSARKFFGVPDGAYLYTTKELVSPLAVEISSGRMSHLIERIEASAEMGYHDFQHNENSLSNLPIRQMSAISDRILQSVDYEYVRNKRRQNFSCLHAVLKDINQLKLNLEEDIVPMVYPFWSLDKTLRKKLLENQIFVATYWLNVLKWCKVNTLENNWAQHLIPLPIDQRYGTQEMAQILKVILA